MKIRSCHFPPCGTTSTAVDFSPSKAAQISTNIAAARRQGCYQICLYFTTDTDGVDRFHDSPRQLKDVSFINSNPTVLKLEGVCDIFPPLWRLTEDEELFPQDRCFVHEVIGSSCRMKKTKQNT